MFTGNVYVAEYYLQLEHVDGLSIAYELYRYSRRSTYYIWLSVYSYFSQVYL